MAEFKFIHAADLHLDSPLRGLANYEGAPVETIRQASRQALKNLVQAAIEHAVQFVVIAGDIYDGDWRNFDTGLFFVQQMLLLQAAGIPVIMISGNHDAANRMTKDLPLPENVKRLQHNRCETYRLEDLGVSIHGQSFARAAVTENLATSYASADAGNFNLGLLHTSASGFDEHEPYAPCAIDDMRAKGYDYWALGHIHRRLPLHREGEPPIHFPGNLQGRHIREVGPKGCLLVTVDQQHTAQTQFLPLDVFRWNLCEIDATGAETPYDVIDLAIEQLQHAVREAEDRGLAVRVVVRGACRAHEKLAAQPEQWVNEIRALAMQYGQGKLWIEKVKLQSRLPSDTSGTAVEGPAAELIHKIGHLASDPDQAQLFMTDLSDLLRKLPVELREGADALQLEDPRWLAQAMDDAQHLLVQRLQSVWQEGNA